MKKILYTNFKNIDELISKLGEQPEFKRAIKRSNLYKFWAKAAGEKFSKHSKPYSMIKGNIMVIACETPAVAQELMLRKSELLTKLKPYVESLKMNVADLKFDSKKWVAEKSDN